MIDLYTWTTPNGFKASIMLEEIGLPYTAHGVNIGKGEQHTPEFLAKNLNAKIPVIVDRDGPDGKPVTIFESGAILIYLAEKSGQLLPKDTQGRFEAIEWVMFQMSAVGPMFGQLGYFSRTEPKNLGAIERFAKESQRILGVLDQRLADREFLAGPYSIADVATYPWVAGAKARSGELLAPYSRVESWLTRVQARPAVQRGMAVPKIG